MTRLEEYGLWDVLHSLVAVTLFWKGFGGGHFGQV